MRNFNRLYDQFNQDVQRWVNKHLPGLFIFTLLIVALVLLRSVGYFAPFLPISINSIFFIAFVLSIFLLGARSKAFFLIAFLFWVFAAFLRILNINVWAERTAIYTFQALVLGITLFLFENIVSNLFKR